MVGVIQMQDFLMQSWYGGLDTFRDYRLRHLPTGLQWDVRGRAGLTILQKMRQLVAAANRDLTSLGWQPDEDWQRRLAELSD
jgi:hypothetical protein